jgi:hypothetical protein
MNPLDLVSFNLPELRKGLYAQSIATLDGVRTKVFTDWGLDFPRIRAWQGCPVTFNYFNFSTKQVGVLLNGDLDSDYLCACVSLISGFRRCRKTAQCSSMPYLPRMLMSGRPSVVTPTRFGRSGRSQMYRGYATASSRSTFIFSGKRRTRTSSTLGIGSDKNAFVGISCARKCTVSAICSSRRKRGRAPKRSRPSSDAATSLTPNRSTSTAR